MAYNIGLTGPFDYAGTIQNDFFASMVNWFANRTPLVTRLPNRPVSATTVRAVDDSFRPGSTTLSGAYTAAGTTLAVTDGSFFTPGDVVQVDAEFFLVTGVSGNTLTVTIAYAGTTNAGHASGATVHVVSRTSTGAEVDADALTYVPDTADTTPQTILKAYQIGGSLEASSSNMAIPGGLASMVGWQRFKAMQENLDDFERSLYYGRYVPLAGDATRPMMRGLRQRLTSNVTTAPTNASAYGPTDLLRDTVIKCRQGGGNPDLLVLSTDWLGGLAKWGMTAQRVPAGETAFGTPINVLQSPFNPNLAIVEAPLLRSGTAICLTSSEVYMGWKREPFDKPRGSRGDAHEGDVIGEGCVVLNNQAHHAWVEGVTGFAAI